MCNVSLNRTKFCKRKLKSNVRMHFKIIRVVKHLESFLRHGNHLQNGDAVGPGIRYSGKPVSIKLTEPTAPRSFKTGGLRFATLFHQNLCSEMKLLHCNGYF